MATVPTTSALPWIRIAEAARHLGETVEIRGWIVHKRSSGKVQFLVVRDGSGIMQCVARIADVTPAACEGTTTLFETAYFDDKAYLTQSGQLYMEAAAMALGRVYCFGPAFRAEKSKTRRHLIEFWMMEPEWAWATLDDVIALEERLLVYTVGRVVTERAEDFRIVERDLAKLEQVQAPFPRIHYNQ